MAVGLRYLNFLLFLFFFVTFCRFLRGGWLGALGGEVRDDPILLVELDLNVVEPLVEEVDVPKGFEVDYDLEEGLHRHLINLI